MPDSKSGAKTVPLAAAALALLTTLPRHPKSPYVLAAAKGGGHYTGIGKEWDRLRKRACLAGLRLHDLRHSFASSAVAGGVPLFTLSKLLGHRQARSSEVYAHLRGDPLRDAADSAAAPIAAALRLPRAPAPDEPAGSK